MQTKEAERDKSTLTIQPERWCLLATKHDSLADGRQ